MLPSLDITCIIDKFMSDLFCYRTRSIPENQITETQKSEEGSEYSSAMRTAASSCPSTKLVRRYIQLYIIIYIYTQLLKLNMTRKWHCPPCFSLQRDILSLVIYQNFNTFLTLMKVSKHLEHLLDTLKNCCPKIYLKAEYCS